MDNSQASHEGALVKWRNDGSPFQIEFKLADAQDLPFPDDSFDRALRVDTLEWVEQPVKALQEIRRILKPGGSAVIIHSDFDTQVFHCSDRRLGREIVNAFTDTGPNGQIGRALHGLCARAGFTTVRPDVFTLINTEWKPNLYSFRAAHMKIDWLTANPEVSKEKLDLWLSDLEATASKGDYFYSINRNICWCLKKVRPGTCSLAWNNGSFGV